MLFVAPIASSPITTLKSAPTLRKTVPAFVKALNDQELLFLCGHEVLHCVFDHFDRREDRNPQIYNMAGDYVINLLLVEESVGEKINTVPILLDYIYS